MEKQLAAPQVSVPILDWGAEVGPDTRREAEKMEKKCSWPERQRKREREGGDETVYLYVFQQVFKSISVSAESLHVCHSVC